MLMRLVFGRTPLLLQYYPCTKPVHAHYTLTTPVLYLLYLLRLYCGHYAYLLPPPKKDQKEG